MVGEFILKKPIGSLFNQYLEDSSLKESCYGSLRDIMLYKYYPRVVPWEYINIYLLKLHLSPSTVSLHIYVKILSLLIKDWDGQHLQESQK